MNADDKTIPSFLSRTITFDNGTTYELLDPLTNYRSCHDGTPLEARMVFLAAQITPPVPDQFVVKIKVQLPSDSYPPQATPSTTTAHELVALTKFRDSSTPYAPHLTAFKSVPQDASCPLPGGYITFTVMTKMPGASLFGRFWNMASTEREEITTKALEALREIYTLGIEPVDRGLRNVIWDDVGKRCSIIDFELWNEVGEVFKDQVRELQRWGLARRPPPRDWWVEWNMSER